MQLWTDLVLSTDLIDLVDEEFAESKSFSENGATEEQIQDLERRLGRSLPPSYRSFLAFSNGWNGTYETPIMPMLYPAEKVDYIINSDPILVSSWLELDIPPTTPEIHLENGSGKNVEIFRAEYLKKAIQISEPIDGALFLLVPDVVQEGEFEAWMIASWLNGAIRYPSLWKLLSSRFEIARARYQR